MLRLMDYKIMVVPRNSLVLESEFEIEWDTDMVHKVFLRFPNLALTKNLSPSTLVDSIRASLHLEDWNVYYSISHSVANFCVGWSAKENQIGSRKDESHNQGATHAFSARIAPFWAHCAVGRCFQPVPVDQPIFEIPLFKNKKDFERHRERADGDLWARDLRNYHMNTEFLRMICWQSGLLYENM